LGEGRKKSDKAWSLRKKKKMCWNAGSPRTFTGQGGEGGLKMEEEESYDGWGGEGRSMAPEWGRSSGTNCIEPTETKGRGWKKTSEGRSRITNKALPAECLEEIPATGGVMKARYLIRCLDTVSMKDNKSIRNWGRAKSSRVIRR